MLVGQLLVQYAELVVGLMLGQTVQGRAFLHVAIHIEADSVNHAVVGNATLDEIVVLPRFLAQTAGHNEVHPLLVVEREVQVAVIGLSRILVELIDVNHRMATAVEGHLTGPLLGMLAKERHVEALAKVQVVAPSQTVGTLNALVGSVIQFDLRSSLLTLGITDASIALRSLNRSLHRFSSSQRFSDAIRLSVRFSRLSVWSVL